MEVNPTSEKGTMSQIDSNYSALLSVPTQEKSTTELNMEQPQNVKQTVNETVKLLLDFSSRKSSGVLEFSYNQVHWKIFLESGALQYASTSIQTLESLGYHLRFLEYKQAIEAIKSTQAKQNQVEDLSTMSLDLVIGWLGEKGFLNTQQVSELARQVSLEAMEPLLWLGEINSSWEEINPEVSAVSITPPLDISGLVKEFSDRLQSWQPLLDQINSPYQRPYCFRCPTDENASSQMLVKLSKLMRGFSIHQLAKIVKKDEIKLAQMLYPHVKSGEIFLRDPQPNWDQLPVLPKVAVRKEEEEEEEKTVLQGKAPKKVIKIACVDDSPTILREMQRLLGEENYEITKIDNPVEAASILFRVKPDLVLMDISMPEINGYKLCNLLRNSNALSRVPIIMVTSRTGMIDKVRAKASGATDYLTKPFTKASLLEVVEKHLTSI